MKHTAGKNLSLTGNQNRHPTEKAMTEEVHDEEYVVKTLSKLFKLNHIYGQLLKTNRKFRSTDQSAGMTWKTNSEFKSEIASPKKFNPDANSKSFTRKLAEAIKSINTNVNPI